MSAHQLPEIERRGLAAFVRRFPQVHLGIGLLGNAFFIAGSVLFLLQEQRVGVYAFLTGSTGMFVGQLGEVIRGLGHRRLQRYDVDPWSG